MVNLERYTHEFPTYPFFHTRWIYTTDPKNGLKQSLSKAETLSSEHSLHMGMGKIMELI